MHTNQNLESTAHIIKSKILVYKIKKFKILKDLPARCGIININRHSSLIKIVFQEIKILIILLINKLLLYITPIERFITDKVALINAINRVRTSSQSKVTL